VGGGGGDFSLVGDVLFSMYTSKSSMEYSKIRLSGGDLESWISCGGDCSCSETIVVAVAGVGCARAPAPVAPFYSLYFWWQPHLKISAMYDASALFVEGIFYFLHGSLALENREMYGTYT
jgi:hypothetical protein